MLQSNADERPNVRLFLILLPLLCALSACTSTPAFRSSNGQIVKGSIAEQRYIILGGVKQYVLLRGESRNAPILIYLHGGPGESETPVFRIYNAALEKYFLVVYWDQRDAGKSFDPRINPKSLTLKQIASDLDELVNLLLKEFGKKQVLLVGHSWGTVLALEYITHHPKKVAAYIGIGQVTNLSESEKLSYEWVLAQAIARGDRRAMRALHRIGAPPYGLRNLSVERKYLLEYGGAFHIPRTNCDIYRTALKAPETSILDLIPYLRGELRTLKAMWSTYMQTNTFAEYPSVGVPVFLMEGRYDHQVSSKLAAEYFQRLKAPYKELIRFEKSGHSPPFEEPVKFDNEVVRIARQVGFVR